MDSRNGQPKFTKSGCEMSKKTMGTSAENSADGNGPRYLFRLLNGQFRGRENHIKTDENPTPTANPNPQAAIMPDLELTPIPRRSDWP